jgi:hypothetical protein
MTHAPALALVTVVRLDTVGEAAVVQAMLESAGIAVTADGAWLIGLDWSLSQALGGVRLQVPGDRAEEALDLVAAYQRGDAVLVDADPDDANATVCPCCGSSDLEARAPARQKLLLILMCVFPGALFPTRQSLRTCRDCGLRWSIDP